jgi:hypothetical protein
MNVDWSSVLSFRSQSCNPPMVWSCWSTQAKDPVAISTNFGVSISLSTIQRSVPMPLARQPELHLKFLPFLIPFRNPGCIHMWTGSLVEDDGYVVSVANPCNAKLLKVASSTEPKVMISPTKVMPLFPQNSLHSPLAVQRLDVLVNKCLTVQVLFSGLILPKNIACAPRISL